MTETTVRETSDALELGCYRCGKEADAGDTVHYYKWDGEWIYHHAERCCSSTCPDARKRGIAHGG